MVDTAINWEKTNIIRLDDHQIVLDGFTQWCRWKTSELEIRNFKNSDEVFMQIVTSLIKGEKIDLFITDFAHPGLDGYEMCKSIRVLEKALMRPQMPILLLTLYTRDCPPIKAGLEEGVFTRYLSLEAGPEETVECIMEMLKIRVSTS